MQWFSQNDKSTSTCHNETHFLVRLCFCSRLNLHAQCLQTIFFIHIAISLVSCPFKITNACLIDLLFRIRLKWNAHFLVTDILRVTLRTTLLLKANEEINVCESMRAYWEYIIYKYLLCSYTSKKWIFKIRLLWNNFLVTFFRSFWILHSMRFVNDILQVFVSDKTSRGNNNEIFGSLTKYSNFEVQNLIWEIFSSGIFRFTFERLFWNRVQIIFSLENSFLNIFQINYSLPTFLHFTWRIFLSKERCLLLSEMKVHIKMENTKFHKLFPNRFPRKYEFNDFRKKQSMSKAL